MSCPPPLVVHCSGYICVVSLSPYILPSAVCVCVCACMHIHGPCMYPDEEDCAGMQLEEVPFDYAKKHLSVTCSALC